ncbi:hypothetical protein [Methylocystis bryophila]|uniref:hypothetical protein n=1 Tax=Methylocystis bryophila TaxID=655015 RepID=UPI003DB10BA8
MREPSRGLLRRVLRQQAPIHDQRLAADGEDVLDRVDGERRRQHGGELGIAERRRERVEALRQPIDRRLLRHGVNRVESRRAALERAVPGDRRGRLGAPARQHRLGEKRCSLTPAESLDAIDEPVVLGYRPPPAHVERDATGQIGAHDEESVVAPHAIPNPVPSSDQARAA